MVQPPFHVLINKVFLNNNENLKSRQHFYPHSPFALTNNILSVIKEYVIFLF